MKAVASRRFVRPTSVLAASNCAVYRADVFANGASMSRNLLDDLPRPLRLGLLGFTHLFAVCFGFGVLFAATGLEFAFHLRATPTRRLTGVLFGPTAQITRSRLTNALAALDGAKSEIGEPVASVLELELQALFAKSSGDDRAIARAVELCHARNWPHCEPNTILAMGGQR